MVSLHNDGILSTEVIRGQFVGPPDKTLIGIGQEFDKWKLFSEFDTIIAEIAPPDVIKQLSVVVVKETDISKEGWRQENITQNWSQLHLEVFAGILPTIFFRGKIIE